jgi:hypothetical protein
MHFPLHYGYSVFRGRSFRPTPREVSADTRSRSLINISNTLISHYLPGRVPGSSDRQASRLSRSVKRAIGWGHPLKGSLGLSRCGDSDGIIVLMQEIGTPSVDGRLATKVVETVQESFSFRDCEKTNRHRTMPSRGDGPDRARCRSWPSP